MSIEVSFLSREQIIECCKLPIIGRVLSINVGKNLCMGVLHFKGGYCMFRYNKEDYEINKICRGDILKIDASIYEYEGKKGININKVFDVIKCKGMLPNKQFKGESENNRIVQCMFEPNKYAIIQGYSDIIKALRMALYSKDFDEISTPILFQQQSPSNAECFKVETINGQTLYLKSIHEHLLKPYLLLGFSRVFEMGAVFRNIGYSHEYDCEFHNLDMWIKNISLEQLIDWCIEMTRIAANAIKRNELLTEIFTYDDYVEKKQIEEANDKKVKEHIKKNGKGKIIVIKEPLRLKNFHIRETTDQRHNQEFHAYINGVSYAHGYCVRTDNIVVDSTLSSEKCQIFEEYAVYGVEDFGGLGIGLKKMMQGLFEVDDYHLLNLYRRKY